jgi:hypothetical protein
MGSDARVYLLSIQLPLLGRFVHVCAVCSSRGVASTPLLWSSPAAPGLTLPPCSHRPAVGQFLDYCKQYMSDLQARQQLGKVAVPLAEIAAGVLVHADEEEEYYDAARAQSPLSMYSAGSGGGGGRCEGG